MIELSNIVQRSNILSLNKAEIRCVERSCQYMCVGLPRACICFYHC